MITNEQFKKFVGNKVFSVDFIKQDGSLRTMNARVDVKKWTHGGNNPVEHYTNYVTVFEMDKQQYRTLNLETVVRFKCGGRELSV